MKTPGRKIIESVFSVEQLLMGTAYVTIEAGHEGLLVEQPYIFGHSGIDPIPSKNP